MKEKWKKLCIYWNRPNHAAYLFLAAPLLLMVVFIIAPLMGTMVLGFFKMNIFLKDPEFVGLENFKRFFTDTRAINSLWHTLYYAVWQVPLQIIIGLVLAAMLSQNTLLNKFSRSVFFVPTVCSLTATSIIWSMLLDPYIGSVPYLLKTIGMKAPGFHTNPALALPTVALITVWKNFGMTLMILLGGIHGISQSLYESAEMDGANGVQRFFYITLPQIIPSLSFCMLTNFIGAMQVFDQVYIMTGGGPQFKTETAVQYIYTRGFNAPYELGYASAVSWSLFLLIAVLTIAMDLFMSRKEKKYS